VFSGQEVIAKLLWLDERPIRGRKIHCRGSVSWTVNRNKSDRLFCFRLT
jgi:hypothetical protein